MNVNKHVLEIKNRLALLILTWLTTIFSCYFFKEIILYNIITTYDKFYPYFIVTEVSELFNIYFELSFFIGNQLLILFCIYHSVMFLSTGLYAKEIDILKRTYKIILTICAISFLFNQLITMPIMSAFFFNFKINLTILTQCQYFLKQNLKNI